MGPDHITVALLVDNYVTQMVTLMRGEKLSVDVKLVDFG